MTSVFLAAMDLRISSSTISQRDDFGSAEPVKLSQNNDDDDDSEPMWSPDGKRLVFYSSRRTARPRRRIFFVNTDGSNEMLMPGTNEDFRPVWSPDGKRIAFDSYRDGNHEIYVANLDGSNLIRLTNSPGYDSCPRWTPDSKKIVYFSGAIPIDGSSYPYGNSDIFVVNVDGTNRIRLTTADGDDTYPFWSANGKKIAFTSNRDGNYEIYVMNSDGTNQTRLTNNPARDDGARWSPDGRKIGFSSKRDGNYEVYMMNADGSQQTNLTRHPANDVDPSWSPDGKQIAFSSNRSGNYDIYFMKSPKRN